MAWIFQGNPSLFDIDDYLARYPELVYWRAPRYRSKISPGDRAFIWRAGADAGVVASGTIAEGAVEASGVLHPEALGDDLWYADKPDVDVPKVGVELDSVRLSAAEGMLMRTVVKSDPVLQRSTIVRMPNSTVFHLDDREHSRMEELWAISRDRGLGESDISASEGSLVLRAHRRRERSRFLVRKKLEAFRGEHGLLTCEVCGLRETGAYPETLAQSVFEIHHIEPLSNANTPRRTTLSDLVVICANCHRAIHATSEVESNLRTLKQAFETGIPTGGPLQRL